MMIKPVRRMIEIAETEGLKLDEIEMGARHILLLFRNDRGDVMQKPVSKGQREDWQDEHNARAQFKRFARGQHHGLIIVEKS